MIVVDDDDEDDGGDDGSVPPDIQELAPGQGFLVGEQSSRI